MTLDELRSLITGSTVADWYRIQGEATFRDQFSQISDTDHTWLEHTGHHSTATFRADVSITVAWALDFTDREFINLEYLRDIPFADTVTRHYVDLFAYGALVERVAVDYVDGNYLPTPTPHFADHVAGTPTRVLSWTVSVFEAHVAALVDGLSNHHAPDRARKLERALFLITSDR